MKILIIILFLVLIIKPLKLYDLSNTMRDYLMKLDLEPSFRYTSSDTGVGGPYRKKNSSEPTNASLRFIKSSIRSKDYIKASDEFLDLMKLYDKKEEEIPSEAKKLFHTIVSELMVIGDDDAVRALLQAIEKPNCSQFAPEIVKLLQQSGEISETFSFALEALSTLNTTVAIQGLINGFKDLPTTDFSYYYEFTEALNECDFHKITKEEREAFFKNLTSQLNRIEKIPETSRLRSGDNETDYQNYLTAMRHLLQNPSLRYEERKINAANVLRDVLGQHWKNDSASDNDVLCAVNFLKERFSTRMKIERRKRAILTDLPPINIPEIINKALAEKCLEHKKGGTLFINENHDALQYPFMTHDYFFEYIIEHNRLTLEQEKQVVQFIEKEIQPLLVKQ